MDIEKLKKDIGNLTDMLQDPQPGLITWNIVVGNILKKITSHYKQDSGERFVKWLSENLSHEDPDDGLIFYPTESGGVTSVRIDGSRGWEGNTLDQLIDEMDKHYAKYREEIK